jgi:hypothetical protein
MIVITNKPGLQQSQLDGPYPTFWIGQSAVDGDRGYWVQVPVGSLYGLKSLANNNITWYEKRKNDGRDDDWGPQSGLQNVTETVLFSDFTDGGSTSGTYTLKRGVPIGAYYYKTLIQNVTGFTGDTSAALIVGDGTDTDRYNTGTPSVFTTDTSVDVGVPSGTAYHDAAKDIILTVTSNSDFTLVVAGQLTIKCFFFN